MKKAFAKITSLLLTLALLLSFLPAQALAEGEAHQWSAAPVQEVRHSGGIVTAPVTPAFDTATPRRSAKLAALPAFRLPETGATPVKDQNPYGTCWAFAAMASSESLLEVSGRATEPDLSEWQMAYFAYTAHNSMPSFTVGSGLIYDLGGNDYMASALIARGTSPVLESEAPYSAVVADPGSIPSSAIAPSYILKNWMLAYKAFNTVTNVQDNSEWKSMLTTKGALSISYTHDSYYSTYDYNGQTTTNYYRPSFAFTNHAVTLVGWDDNYPATAFITPAPGNGAWIVKNSWGTGWGDSGYFYLSYYDRSLSAVAAAYELAAPAAGEKIYTYDELGWVSNLGYTESSDPSSAALKSVFTAAGAETLTSVGTFAVGDNTAYSIMVTVKNPATGAFENVWGTPQSGTIVMAGYSQISLANPVSLSAGQDYEVVIKYTVPGEIYPVPVEAYADYYSTNVTISPSKSFISYDGYNWDDMTNDTDIEERYDACIFAHTVPATGGETCTVQFGSQGGSAVAPVTLSAGSLVPRPSTDPAKAGCSFAGWYREPECTTLWQFESDKVVAGRTLYAKWTPNQYTVNLDSRGGSAVPSYAANYGSLISKPAAPIWDGHRFLGWFKEAECANPWNFDADTMPASDITLYAGWALGQYTVSFDSRGGSAVGSVGAGYGSTIAEPAAPKRTGYYFAGWYKEASCVHKWNFSADVVTADVVLYARWATQTQAATLSGIKLSAGSLSPAFSAVRRSYTVYLNEYTGAVTVTPVKTSASATLYINGRKAASKTLYVANGRSASMTVKVVCGRKSTTVRLTAKRAKSSNNLLASLKASAGTLSPAFNPNVTSYKLTLPEGTARTKITAAKASKLASITNSSRTYTLKNGQTIKATVKVRSQSGKTRTYTVTITRAKSTNALLSSLLSSVKGLTPAFRYYTMSYTLKLPAYKSYVTLSWRTANSLAKATVSGKRLTYKRINVAHGQTVPVAIVVKAQAGNTRTYTVMVTRQ